MRAAARGAPALLAAAVLFGGCAGVAEVTGTATQEDVLQLRSDLTALQTSVRQMRSQAGAPGSQADARLVDRTTELERQTAALTRRLDGLATTLTTLTGRVDEVGAKVDSLNRPAPAGARPAPSPAPPATATPSGTAAPPTTAVPSTPPSASPRPTPPAPPVMPSPAGPTASPVPGAAPAPGPATAVPAAPPPSVASIPPPGARPSTGALQPQDVYQAAYIDFSKGSYPLAINGFREFLRRYPEHLLASNAQYWIGEAHLAMARGHADARQADDAARALQQAVQEFRKVLANYPRGDKAPAALYKEALVLIELKQPDLAQSRLQYLIDNFPQAEETPLARERLTALKDR
jgi:tol-pal system protein YbgF